MEWAARDPGNVTPHLYNSPMVAASIDEIKNVNEDRIEWTFEANRWAARAVQAWAVGRGFGAEIADLRVASNGDLIAAPGLRQALDGLEKASIEACNAAEVIHRIARMDFSEGADDKLEPAFEKLAEAVLIAEMWMRRLAELCMGVTGYLSSTDAVERTDRAAVITVKQPFTGEELLGDGLWPRSKGFAELTTELVGYVSRMIVDHNCRLEITPTTGEQRFNLHVDIDDVGNLSLKIESVETSRPGSLLEIGWRRDGHDYVASWDDPLPVMEPVVLIVDSLASHLGIQSPDELDMAIL